ncbi:GntR family transcriptional regulator [Nissabacter archeti]|uniref:GntR family transcriptional regulator n=1 Tax=Nissabacter archeti TaxID=1917880 RepID=A0ABS5JBM6_9GAMM|nr:GntR family transcriptional regulator [Nissabacter archeti]MBS0967363.1 GntR family transcriptional regulator [Nissabacter archeti]
MSRPQHLRQSVINQMLDGITKGHLPSPLPSQAALAELYNISRTTVRHTLDYLQQRGILARRAGQFCIARAPAGDEGFQPGPTPDAEQAGRVEAAFHEMIRQRQLRPGDAVSEVQLAKSAAVSAGTVHDFLLRFSRYGLLEAAGRGEWLMKPFDQAYAENLFELREMLETHALQRFLTLPANDPRWMQARDLLTRHRQLHTMMDDHYRRFAGLDRELHALIMSAADNPFFNQTLEIISVIFHFHYQWDEHHLKQRNIVATEEHMALLLALICRNDQEAMRELRAHLATARRTMSEAIRGQRTLDQRKTG